MTHEAQQLESDLRYVRQVVARREGLSRGPWQLYVLWAVYVLVGYAGLDFAPQIAGYWLAIGGIVCGIATGVITHRDAQSRGEVDRQSNRRSGMHFGGGILLAVAATMLLTAVQPTLRGPQAGQVCVAMIGLIYFTAGLHYEKRFVVLGLILIVGAAAVGLVDRYAWTILGVVVAVGLVAPSLIPAGRKGTDGTP